MLVPCPILGFGGGVGVLSSIVQQASATSTGATITAPADIQAGDLLVLGDRAANVLSSPTAVTPSGWTNIVNTSGAFNRQMFSYKIADGSEGSSTITGMNGDSTDRKVMVTFRGNIPFATATPNTFGAQYTDGNPSAQTVASSGGTPPLIIFGIYGSDDNIDPRTFTVGGSAAKDGEVEQGNVPDIWVAWKIDVASSSDASIDMDDEFSGNCLQSGYIALTG